MIRLLAIAAAIATNAAALAAVHGAIREIHDREMLARQQPARIVVVSRHAESPVATVQTCPAPSRSVL